MFRNEWTVENIRWHADETANDDLEMSMVTETKNDSVTGHRRLEYGVSEALPG